MSFEHLSTNQPSLFTEPENAGGSPAPRVKSARSANRAAWWEQDLSRTATYLMGQARSDEERAFVERLYGEAMAEGAGPAPPGSGSVYSGHRFRYCSFEVPQGLGNNEIGRPARYFAT